MESNVINKGGSMGKLLAVYESQTEVVAQLDIVLRNVGTVVVMQNNAGAGGEDFGEILLDEYGFRYCGRGIYTRNGFLSKLIITLDRNADGSRFIRSIDVYQETTVIAREEHYSTNSRKRPNILCLGKDEIKVWQDDFDKRMEELLDA